MLRPAILAALLLLTACAPALLRTPPPAQGSRFTIGGSIVGSQSPGGSSPIAPVAYIGFAFGNGWTEANATVQPTVTRFGLKQRLLEDNNLSLELGVGAYLFPGPTSSDFRGIFDLGLIYGYENWYFSPRYNLVSAGGFDYVSLYQFHLGYAFTPNPLVEVGVWANNRGATGFSLSFGLRTAPAGP